MAIATPTDTDVYNVILSHYGNYHHCLH